MSPKYRLAIIFILTVLATVGSFYIEAFGDPLVNLMLWDLFNASKWILPCTLCRYTRILLFPLVLITWIALWQKDRLIRKTILPFCVLGIVVTAYNYGIEMHRRANNPELCWLNNSVKCGNPSINYRWRGTLSLAGFCIFFIGSIGCLQIKQRIKKHPDSVLHL